MTKTYAILQKKLQELELQLSHNNNNLPTTILPSHLSQEIPQKLLFLANLLSAETASCPTKPRHLKHIARRLTHLEAAFRDSGTEHLLLDHADDSSSTCSCTESCLHDDGEVASTHASSCLEDEEEGGEFYYECVEEDEKEEMMMMKKKKEERKIVGVGKLCGAMARGFIIGMALMGVVCSIEIFGFLQVQQNNGGFVTPT